jgi:hypothetical protein
MKAARAAVVLDKAAVASARRFTYVKHEPPQKAKGAQQRHDALVRIWDGAGVPGLPVRVASIA